MTERLIRKIMQAKKLFLNKKRFLTKPVCFYFFLLTAHAHLHKRQSNTSHMDQGTLRDQYINNTYPIRTITRVTLILGRHVEYVN